MVFKSTTEKLRRAEEDLQATESVITGLRAEREALLEDGEPESFAKLDNRIADRERQADVFRQRIPLLQRRLDDEQRAASRAKREEAIAQAEKILPIRMMAIEAIAKWAAGIARAVFTPACNAGTARLCDGGTRAPVTRPRLSQQGLCRLCR